MTRREFISLLGGTAAAWPMAARAQQATTPVVGFLVSGSPTGAYSESMQAVRDGIKSAGLTEGDSVSIEYRWANGQYDLLPSLAAELVQRNIAVIFATGSIVSAVAAKRATSTIPIVFANGSDPVKFGLVSSLARPGGNITGVSFYNNALVQKRLELLRELLPRASQVAILVNSNNPNTQADIEDVQAAAQTLGLRVVPISMSRNDEIDAVFARIVALKSDALIVTTDAVFQSLREPLVAAALSHRVPAIWGSRTQSQAGGLASYGTNVGEMYRLAGNYVGRVVKGEKPANLPVQQPTKFEFVLNLRTARAIGLDVSATLLARADEVIE
jgi:putative tryptophan/tyrosine transport system substrate-binding protein